ncbi:MAG: alpha-amylase family protein [Bryobacteraceae bacterium]|jgi:hypothetical protein
MNRRQMMILSGAALASNGAAAPSPQVSAQASAANVGWMRTARVFLIDAYEPPFATVLEYDAKALAETMVRMNANTVRIATMGKYALIQGVRFSPHPELGNRDILAETIAACQPRGIRVVPYISTGHKLAWTMVTKDYPEYAQRTTPGGGPARSHFYVGEDHGTVCWNTPYRQAYLDLVEHVVRDYDVAGMYFDRWVTSYFWPGRQVCYCDGCRNGFRKATGLELPWREDGGYTSAELAATGRYHAWLQEELVDLVLQVRKIVKSHKDVPMIYNINNPQAMAGQDPRIREANDAFLYERGNSILERAEGVSLARASGMGVWPYVGEYNNWPRAIYNAFDFEQQIFTTSMFGGAPILALPWGYVQHAANRRFVEYPFEVMKSHEREFALPNYPYAAVVYAYRTPPGHAQTGTWWRMDVRTSTLGAFAALLYGHVQVSSVDETLLDDAERLAAYKVLYLADVTSLSETRLANVKRFVREGGGLVASYATSLFDATRAANRLDRFGLEEVIRVAPFQPPKELADLIANYSSNTGGPYDLYLADRQRPDPQALTPLWHYLPVKALDGGEVWKEIVTGDGLRPILPGVIVSRYGKGCAVYCASALESLFVQQNSSAVGEMVRALVAKAASEPPPYEIEAPSALIANLTAKDNVLVLHLTNWTGDKMERAGANEYYLAPVENVRVRLAIPAGKRVRSVAMLVKAPYKQEQKGPTLEVVIPRVEAYQGVRVEMG